jgi:hypothetical protein
VRPEIPPPITDTFIIICKNTDKVVSKKEGPKKFYVPLKKAVLLLGKILLFCRVPQIFWALLILKRL